MRCRSYRRYSQALARNLGLHPVTLESMNEHPIPESRHPMSDHIDTEAWRNDCANAEDMHNNGTMNVPGRSPWLTIATEQLRALLDAYDLAETLRKERDELQKLNDDLCRVLWLDKRPSTSMEIVHESTQTSGLVPARNTQSIPRDGSDGAAAPAETRQDPNNVPLGTVSEVQKAVDRLPDIS